MEEQIIEALQMCVECCDSLTKLMRDDEETFRRCIGGELHALYDQSTVQARKVVDRIAEQAGALQQEQVVQQMLLS